MPSATLQTSMLLRGSLLKVCAVSYNCPVSASSLSERPLSKPAVGPCDCPAYRGRDAPVIVFMSVQVLQVSCLSTRNLLSDSTKYWRSTVILSAPFLSVARWRYFVLRTEVKSAWVVKAARCRSPVLMIMAVGWVVPRDGPVAGKTRSYGVLVLPEACLRTCLEAWFASASSLQGYRG
ncbi:hypothetical protein Tco_0652906 [Tanacetum coccineum]|uniref:Uncharacterized protein n=1 Tax=Tanacetum coccineum TaxID=301880 RepID=A0ABQ4WYX8_9ASTR